ncbi:hypothetical protein PoB_004686500 [Plakobranchus ocellatus]|uniref:Uncharacterized protein n=1 Tax=Plakobranchus ocellatus TaxID=259542 RepID=A0AAV4BLP6_9GAST|nr:hypothetical protein PoB_004686500 [Plakobranchus ocellatus]
MSSKTAGIRGTMLQCHPKTAGIRGTMLQCHQRPLVYGEQCCSVIKDRWSTITLLQYHSRTFAYWNYAVVSLKNAGTFNIAAVSLKYAGTLN